MNREDDQKHMKPSGFGVLTDLFPGNNQKKRQCRSSEDIDITAISDTINLETA